MSYYDYEDYYGEPSEFEQQIDEFKNSLFNAVKQEHKDKMEQLVNNSLNHGRMKDYNIIQKTISQMPPLMRMSMTLKNAKRTKRKFLPQR